MIGNNKRATLQILLFQSQTNGRKIVQDRDLKPVARTQTPKKFAARRRREGLWVNHYVPNATKKAGAAGGYILKSLTEW